MPRPKNIILRKFFEMKGDGHAICKNEKCYKLLNVHAGNLERHLKKVHPIIYEGYIKRKVVCFGNVLARNFKNESATKLSSTVNNKNKQHIQMALIELFTKCGRPLSLAEDQPFKLLVQPTLEGLNINLSEDSIMENIAKFSINIKNEISEELCGRLISLKIDTITRSSVSVLAVNVQFIKNNCVVNKTLAIKRLTERPTIEYLKNLIMEVLESYEINLDQVVTITSDNGANMIKADNDDDCDCEAAEDDFCDETDIMSDLSMDNITNVRCGGHTLQFCTIDVIESTDIKEKLDTIRVIVINLKTQKYINLLKNENYKMPILDNTTRWNSTYLMVERFLILREFIDSYFQVSNEIWSFAAEFIKVFEILYTAAKNLQSQNMLYSDLYIEITNITIKLESLATTDLKLHLTKSLNRQKSKMFENDLFVTAIFLDPRIKVCLTSDQCARAKICIRQLHNRLSNLKEKEYDDQPTKQYEETNDGPTTSALSTAKNAEDALEEYFKSFDQNSSNNISTTSPEIDEDLFIYDKQSRLGIKENIIDFWNIQNNTLAEIAYVVLGIPCTHGSVERLFSALEYILSDQSNKLSSINLEHILLVRTNANFIYD